MARDEIAAFHKIANEEAERAGGKQYFEQAYVKAWYSFRDNPNADTALAFLNVAPTLRTYFEGCAPGGRFYQINSMLNNRDT